MTLDQQSRNIRIVAVVMIGFGLLIALAAYPPLNGFIMLLADILVWPFDGAQTGEDSTARLMMAIGGGIFAGFGAMWFALAGAPLRLAPEPIRHALLIGTITWFVTDSVASALADAPLNIVGNIGFLAFMLWPIWRPAQG